VEIREAQVALRDGMGEQWSRIADAIDLILAGERDEQVVCQALRVQEVSLVETMLRALKDPGLLQSLAADEGSP
jgi:hypothetical protein